MTTLQTSFFADLKAEQKQQISNRREQWEALVLSVANGERLDKVNVADVLESLGKTAAELEAAVQKVLRRRQLITQKTDIERIAAQRPELERQLAELQQAHQKVRDQQNAELQPFQSKLQGIQDNQPRLVSIVGELERMVKGSQTAARMEEIAATLDERGRRRLTMIDEIDDLSGELRALHPGKGTTPPADSMWKEPGHPADAEDRRKKIQQLESEVIPAKRTELAEFEAETKRLQHEYDSLLLTIQTADYVD